MQTFLPLPSFTDSASVLDDKRLGKQRVEAWQIATALDGGGGWSRHPATLMWSGWRPALLRYGLVVCLEWISRGHSDQMGERFDDALRHAERQGLGIWMPPWFGRPDFHASHRSNLLRKDPAWYGRLGWAESPDLPYVWPGQD